LAALSHPNHLPVQALRIRAVAAAMQLELLRVWQFITYQRGATVRIYPTVALRFLDAQDR
jgi:hypothetical protein